MALIYLSHPQHGIKIAYHDAEVAHDMKHGWQFCLPPGTEAENALTDLPKRRRKKNTDDAPDLTE